MSLNGFSTLTQPRPSHSIHKVRPSISRPTNFQRFDNGLGLDGIQSMMDDAPMPIRRNPSFCPLELSIYLPNGCGRLSPLPDFQDDEVWSAETAGLEKPAQAMIRTRDSRTNSLSSNPSASEYLIQRKPVTSSSNILISHSRRSSIQSQNSTRTARRLSGTTMATMQTPSLSICAEEPTSSAASIAEKLSIHRSNTSGTLSPARVLSRLPSPSRIRAKTAPSRSNSLRRTKTDVDEAIRELNTIVEERRASAYRSQAFTPKVPPSPSHHVPYIAPSMRMHVRSETLCDIGSAFSAPIKANKALPDAPLERRRTMGLALAPPWQNSTMALCSNPITPPTSSRSRLTTWLKRSMTTSSTNATRPCSHAPSNTFYKCATQSPWPATPRRSNTPSAHTRQASQQSTTPTLLSVSSRSDSPAAHTPQKKTKPKHAVVPAPLVLAKNLDVEPAVGSSARALKPPMSPPHAHLLRGMDMAAKDVGVDGQRASAIMTRTMHSPGAVGVAF
ncbi:hypothetical protein ACEQ8H_004276 [Pleosporales sp. CAS-2024a]